MPFRLLRRKRLIDRWGSSPKTEGTDAGNVDTRIEWQPRGDRFGARVAVRLDDVVPGYPWHGAPNTDTEHRRFGRRGPQITMLLCLSRGNLATVLANQ
jgi:hypothetical protein